MSNGGGSLQWLSQLSGQPIDRLIALPRSNSDDLLLLPYLNGERSPIWDSNASAAQLLRRHFENSPADKARLLEKIPLGCLASPEEIAREVLILASDDAAYVTGTVFFVDGGFQAQG
jgi:sugar (pentulose or hexulose) kinase